MRAGSATWAKRADVIVPRENGFGPVREAVCRGPCERNTIRKPGLAAGRKGNANVRLCQSETAGFLHRHLNLRHGSSGHGLPRGLVVYSNAGADPVEQLARL